MKEPNMSLPQPGSQDWDRLPRETKVAIARERVRRFIGFQPLPIVRH